MEKLKKYYLKKTNILLYLYLKLSTYNGMFIEVHMV